MAAEEVTWHKPGFVYLMFGRDGLYKIGLSVNPDSRARCLGGGHGAVSVVATVATCDMLWLERTLHAAYHHRRVRDEWFALTPDEAATIAGLEVADSEDDLPTAVHDLLAAAAAHPGYTTTRVDDEVMPLARAAAALTGAYSVTEFISDAVNEHASRILNREPIKRRPPPPKSTGRPPKPRP